jgi:lysophospholipase L1-like esterase
MIPRKLRIVGVGDSTTAGTPEFLSPLESPPDGRGNRESQYTHWIMKVHPEWKVLNRGVNGQRSDEILSRFNRDVVGEKPDYAIILAGVNDLYQGVPLDSIKRNLRAMYTKAIEKNIVPVAATVLPCNSSEMKAAKVNELNRWIIETAYRLHIPSADTSLAVADPANRNRLLASTDGLHPDVSGYHSMAIVLSQAIEEHSKSTTLIERET